MARLQIFVCLILGLAFPALASAGALQVFGTCTSISQASEAGGCVSVAQYFDSDQPPDASSYTPGATLTTSGSTGGSEAEVRVRASFGNVGLFLEATTFAGFGEYSTFARASGEAKFLDTVTVQSATLAAGTPVIATVGFVIDGAAQRSSTSIVGEVTASATAYLSADYAVYGSRNGQPTTLIQFTACSAPDASANGSCDNRYESAGERYLFSLETFIGEQLTVSAGLFGFVETFMGANSDAGFYPSNFGRVSSLNSSHMYFSAEDARFLGSTGFDYAFPVTQQVPEPTTLALLLAGMMGVAASARKRKETPTLC